PKLGRVAQLGHPLGRDEAGGLDLLQTGIEERPDKLQLGRSGDGRLFVLQPVARPNFHDSDRHRVLFCKTVTTPVMYSAFLGRAANRKSKPSSVSIMW